MFKSDGAVFFGDFMYTRKRYYFVMGRFMRSWMYVFSVVGLVIGGVQCAWAVTPAASSCDDKYYAVLESRAWLEAQREITQNQNLIAKPDSVLRYSCFDKALDDYAAQSSLLFSGTVDVSVAKRNATDFVDRNFTAAHNTMLGGRSSVVSGLDGNCNVMAAVWDQAQCMSASDQPDSDGFFTLQHYVDQAGKGKDLRFEGNCKASSQWKVEMDRVTEVSSE